MEHYTISRMREYKALGRPEEYFDAIMCILDSLVEGKELRAEDKMFLDRYRQIKEKYPNTGDVIGGTPSSE